MQAKNNDVQRYIEIHIKDLPLSCPMPNTPTWNSHPKVYLAIEKADQQQIICPYCSMLYILK